MCGDLWVKGLPHVCSACDALLDPECTGISRRTGGAVPDCPETPRDAGLLALSIVAPGPGGPSPTAL